MALLLLFQNLLIFHSSVSESNFFTGIFGVFKPVSFLPLISRSFSNFSSLLVPFQVHQLQLVSLSPSCYTFLAHFVVHLNGKPHSMVNSFFFSSWLILGLVFWPGLGDQFVSQKSKEFYTSHSRGQILVWIYNIY